jgi:hypothetical protein
MDTLPNDYFVTSFQFTPHVFNDEYPSINPRSPSLTLQGKVVIITGASRGVGAKVFDLMNSFWSQLGLTKFSRHLPQRSQKPA